MDVTKAERSISGKSRDPMRKLLYGHVIIPSTVALSGGHHIRKERHHDR
jgi:hypothetical protein